MSDNARPALTLLGHTPLDEFNRHIWGKASHLIKSGLKEIPFSLDEFKEVLLMRAPYACDAVRLSSAESADHDNRKTLVLAKEPIEAVKCIREGTSVTINRLERFLPRSHRLSAIYSDLCSVVGVGTGGLQIAAFFSPPRARAFGKHFDRNHIFVLQVEGEKYWEVGRDDAETRYGLLPGDVLYVPYAMPHAVRGGGDNSLSLTFIMRVPTWRELAVEAILNRLDQSGHPDLSRPSALPFGWIEYLDVAGEGGRAFKEYCDEFSDLGIEPREWLNAAKRVAVQAMPAMPVSRDPFRSVDQTTTLNLDMLLEPAWTEPLIKIDQMESLIVGAPGCPQLIAPPLLLPAIDFIDARRGRFAVRSLPDVYSDETKLLICSKLIQHSFLRICEK